MQQYSKEEITPGLWTRPKRYVRDYTTPDEPLLQHNGGLLNKFNEDGDQKTPEEPILQCNPRKMYTTSSNDATPDEPVLNVKSHHHHLDSNGNGTPDEPILHHKPHQLYTSSAVTQPTTSTYYNDEEEDELPESPTFSEVTTQFLRSSIKY